MSDIKNIFKKVALCHLFIFSSFQVIAQSNCDASFTINYENCPNIHFAATASADSTIICWMFDYGSEGNVDYCEFADNKFNTNGTYEVCLSIMTSDGCMDTFCDSVTIDCICTNPEAGFIFNQNIDTCIFTDTSLTNYSGATWFWDFGDGTTSINQNPTHVYNSPGTFMTCLEVDDSCETDMQCQWIYIEDFSGIKENNLEISIGPNPNTGYFVIRTKQFSASDITIQIYDFSGKIITSRLVTNETEKFNLLDFGSGIYTIRIQDNTTIITKQIIVK